MVCKIVDKKQRNLTKIKDKKQKDTGNCVFYNNRRKGTMIPNRRFNMDKSKQERINVVDELLSRGGLVLTDPLMPATLKNKEFAHGACTGYTFRLNNLSYRGVWISTIESIELIVDEEPVPQCDISLKLGSFSCAVCELENNSDVFWGVTDECRINVNKVGGLSKGDHTVELHIAKRNDFGHSYGEGTDIEGYMRDATELQRSTVVKDKMVYTV